MATERLQTVDIREQTRRYEQRFPMEMGILRIGGVFPGEIRTDTKATNPYTGKPDLGGDGNVEYYGNIGEHCISVATAAERIGTSILGANHPDLDAVVRRALIHDSTKGYEIMRRKAVKAGVIESAYSDSAYQTIKPILEEQGIAPDIVDYMANAGAETGHNSLKDFVTLADGEPVLNQDRSLAEMIVHIADDMTFTPIVNAGEDIPTTFLTVEERMEAADFHNRYPFLYVEGFGFDAEGNVELADDVRQSDLLHVKTYAEWQVWTAKKVAEHLHEQMYPKIAPVEESEVYLKYLAVSGENLVQGDDIVIVPTSETAQQQLAMDGWPTIVIYGEVYDVPGETDYSTMTHMTFVDESVAYRIGTALGFSADQMMPHYGAYDVGGLSINDYERLGNFPQITIASPAQSEEDARSLVTPRSNLLARTIDYTLFAQDTAQDLPEVSVSLARELEIHPDERSDRIVVFGSRLGGAFELSAELRQYLEERGIDGPSVEVYRDVALIESAIEGKSAPQDPIQLARGVVVLPEMRRYECGGETVPSALYMDQINELCERYDIPLVSIQSYAPDQIGGAIRALGSQQSE